MKTNADDSLFPLPLLLLPHHFTLFLHLNGIFWNSRTLLLFPLLFHSHLLPHSRTFLPSFHFLSFIKEMNCNCFEYIHACASIYTLTFLCSIGFAYMHFSFSCIGNHSTTSPNAHHHHRHCQNIYLYQMPSTACSTKMHARTHWLKERKMRTSQHSI